MRELMRRTFTAESMQTQQLNLDLKKSETSWAQEWSVKVRSQSRSYQIWLIQGVYLQKKVRRSSLKGHKNTLVLLFDNF